MARPRADNDLVKGANRGARVLLVVAGIAASLAYSSWIASRTVLDADNTNALAGQLLATPAVHDRLASEATNELDAQLGTVLEDPRTSAQLKVAVDQALRDPRFAAAFSSAIAQLHAALLGNGARQIEINPSAFTVALQRAVGANDPTLARAVAETRPIQLQVGGKNMPSLRTVRDTATTGTIFGALAAVLLVAIALSMDRSRKMAGRLGRRIAYLAFVPLAMFVVLPVFLESHGDAGAITSVVLRSYRGQVVPSAIVVVVLGVAICVGALCWPRRPGDAKSTALGPDAPVPAPRTWDDLPSPLAPATPAAPATRGGSERMYR